MPEYQPKTSWLKHKIAQKTRGIRDYNIAEAKMQTKQMRYLQGNPPFAESTRKLAKEIADDVTAYRQSKWKERGTQTSATRVPVK